MSEASPGISDSTLNSGPPWSAPDPHLGIDRSVLSNLRGTTPGAGAETDLLGELAALLGIVRRHHGIVGRQLPAVAIFFRGHIVGRLELTFQPLELLAIFQTDHAGGSNRLCNR